VHNDDAERYPSPLRDDPRPLDGILHAGYVTARMHWATQALLDRGSLDTRACDEARRWLDIDSTNFADADTVVRRHGRLSATGEAVIASARGYMSEAGSMVA
jgi:HEXXH motif-containing protein